MRIFEQSNFNEVAYLPPGSWNTISQDATERIEMVKTHFTCLGTIATIRRIEGSDRMSRTSWASPLHKSVKPINTYSLDVSIWKVVALIVLLPLYFIQRIMCAAQGLIKIEISCTPIKIRVWRDRNEEIEIEIIPPYDARQDEKKDWRKWAVIQKKVSKKDFHTLTGLYRQRLD